ncbi:uncharacterized protein V1518DRAFT_414571 [Limtongia smithiae]|uniref:uncharacterized protein n=1 Tax=Limtongia smithiae TaxID=1125753 RepID=UPI0034CE1F5B
MTDHIADGGATTSDGDAFAIYSYYISLTDHLPADIRRSFNLIEDLNASYAGPANELDNLCVALRSVSSTSTGLSTVDNANHGSGNSNEHDTAEATRAIAARLCDIDTTPMLADRGEALSEATRLLSVLKRHYDKLDAEITQMEKSAKLPISSQVWAQRRGKKTKKVSSDAEPVSHRRNRRRQHEMTTVEAEKPSPVKQHVERVRNLEKLRSLRSRASTVTIDVMATEVEQEAAVEEPASEPGQEDETAAPEDATVVAEETAPSGKRGLSNNTTMVDKTKELKSASEVSTETPSAEQKVEEQTAEDTTTQVDPEAAEPTEISINPAPTSANDTEHAKRTAASAVHSVPIAWLPSSPEPIFEELTPEPEEFATPEPPKLLRPQQQTIAAPPARSPQRPITTIARELLNLMPMSTSIFGLPQLGYRRAMRSTTVPATQEPGAVPVAEVPHVSPKEKQNALPPKMAAPKAFTRHAALVHTTTTSSVTQSAKPTKSTETNTQRTLQPKISAKTRSASARSASNRSSTANVPLVPIHTLTVAAPIHSRSLRGHTLIQSSESTAAAAAAAAAAKPYAKKKHIETELPAPVAASAPFAGLRSSSRLHKVKPVPDLPPAPKTAEVLQKLKLVQREREKEKHDKEKQKQQTQKEKAKQKEKLQAQKEKVEKVDKTHNSLKKRKQETEDEDEDKRLFCICRDVAHDNMIGCDNKNCEIEWYHLKCLNMKKPPVGEWYCDRCLEQQQQRKRQRRR